MVLNLIHDHLFEFKTLILAKMLLLLVQAIFSQRILIYNRKNTFLLFLKDQHKDYRLYYIPKPADVKYSINITASYSINITPILFPKVVYVCITVEVTVFRVLMM